MEKIYEQLPPDSFEKELWIRKERLANLLRIKSKAVELAPEGKLRISYNKDTVQYYLVGGNSGKNGKYISKSKKDFIKALAQKEYNLKVMPVIKEQLEKLDKAWDFFEKNRLDDVYTHFSDERKKLIEPITLADDDFAERWQSVEYYGKPFYDDAKELYTAKGERVRSKSEVIIADTLNRMGIPYRYEFPVKLKKFTVYPDFYFLNCNNRKEFVWEHFGMMDDGEYVETALEKIDEYQKCGYFAGKNLIVSMESSGRPISSRQVEIIAREYLV